MTASKKTTPAPTQETGDKAAPEGRAEEAEVAAEAAADDAPDPAAEGAAQRIAELEAEVAELRDRALRARAEVENVLKRSERDRQEAAAYSIASFGRDLLAVADNLRRALDALPPELRENAQFASFAEGVEMTERELLAAFERHGISKVVPEGEKFDHNLHQAMAEVETDAQAPGTVVDVYQPGYVLKGRLLRPAMVTVAKNSANAQKAGEGVDTTA